MSTKDPLTLSSNKTGPGQINRGVKGRKRDIEDEKKTPFIVIATRENKRYA